MAPPRTGPTLDCRRCGRPFHVPPVRRNTAHFCSRECHYASRTRARILTKSCPQCGKEFHTYPSQDCRWCSYACTWKSQERKETRACAYCEQPFVVKRAATDKCCSWKCRVARQHTPAWPTWKKILRQCGQCGKEFLSKRHETTRKFCSRICKDYAQRIYDSPAPAFYWLTAWKECRAKVLERDQHRCQQCGFDGSGLHVHHILHKRKGGNEDMNNLVTLCNRCHRMRHMEEPNG